MVAFMEPGFADGVEGDAEFEGDIAELTFAVIEPEGVGGVVV
jgi:hypothetical protein